MADPTQSANRRRSITDEQDPPETTLREVLEEHDLPTAARVAVQALIDKIEARDEEQKRHIRQESWWRRLSAAITTVGLAGIASALAVVGSQIYAHANARAEARQLAELVQKHVIQIERLSDGAESLRVQVAADHALLQLCTVRLGIVPLGAP